MTSYIAEEGSFVLEATLGHLVDDRYFVEDGIAYYAGDDSSLILYPDTQNGKCFSELYEFQNSSVYLRLEYKASGTYVEGKYVGVTISPSGLIQYNHGTQVTGTDVDFYNGENKHYTIYDAAADHAGNVELMQTLNSAASTTVGLVYAGIVLYTCPLAAGPYVGVKVLQLTGASDDFCNDPSFQDILPGFNACDLIEKFLHAYTMFEFGNVVSFSGSIVLEVISDTLMKTLLVDAKENFDSQKLPEAIDYVPIFTKVVSSKLAKNLLSKVALNSIPYGVIIIPQFVGHFTKDISKNYIHDDEFDYSKPSSKVLGNTVCKIILPNSKTDIKATFIYGICYEYVKFAAKELLDVSTPVLSIQDNNVDMKKGS